MDDLLLQFGCAVKAMEAGRVEGLLVPFMDHEKPDFDGEFFDADTDYDREFPTRISTYYDHGLNAKVGQMRLTRADLEMTDAGVLLKDQLDLSDQYQAMVWELAKDNRLYLSSGAVSHLVRKEPAGKAVRIAQWPLGEASYTVQPANPNAIVVSLKSYAAERDLKTLEDQPPVEGAPPAGVAFADHSQSVLAAVSELSARARGLHALRVKSGRILSAANRQRLATLQEALVVVRSDLDALLEETAPQVEADAGKSCPLRHQRIRLAEIEARLCGVV